MGEQRGEILVEAISSHPGECVLHRLPGAKRRPDENQFLAAWRFLSMGLRVSENCINMDPSEVMITEEVKDSYQYPGVRSKYRKRIIFAEVLGDKLDFDVSSEVSESSSDSLRGEC